MFPDKCGAELALSFALGADSSQVVPDHFVVVRGGLKQVPDAGTLFSTVVGATVEEACCAVQHGNVRVTTAGAIRLAGGVVIWNPETSPRGTMNLQHANVIENGPTVFSNVQSNPIPRKLRIDQGQ